MPLFVDAQNNDNDNDDDENQFDELIEDAEIIESFLNFYKKDDKLFLALMEDGQDKDFILNFKIGRGDWCGRPIRRHHAEYFRIGTGRSPKERKQDFSGK